MKYEVEFVLSIMLKYENIYCITVIILLVRQFILMTSSESSREPCPTSWLLQKCNYSFKTSIQMLLHNLL